MVLCHVRKKKKEYNEDDDVEKSRSQNQPAPVLKNKNKMNYKEFRLTVLIHTYNRQMILNLRMHIISHESVFLCICACAHAVKSCLFLDFFFSRCVWQMESGSKWHSYKATPGGDGLVNRYICGHRDWVHVWVCRYMCVPYSQQKCWHTATSVGDGASLNYRWDVPKKTGKHIS